MGTNDKINNCVRKIKQGQKQAFEEFFKITSKKVLFYASYYLIDKQCAEDVLNEVYVKFCDNIEKIDTGINIMNWLIKVAKNTSIDYNRYNKRWDYDSLENCLPSKIVTKSNMEDDIIIKDCIMGLSAEDHKLFYLYYVEERSMRDVAKIINKSKSTVFNDIRKLNEKVKNYLTEVDKRGV